MKQYTDKFALGVEYSGRDYHGWQKQANGIESVQARIEDALGKVANHEISVICAGRTDTAVHASGQVIHFETTARREPKAWIFGVNTQLPKDISVQWAQLVATDFHARFSATARKYTYLIYNSRIRSALYSGFLTREFRPLDEEKMRQAGQHLLGENDFSSFRAAGCQSNTAVRNVMSLQVRREGQIIIIDIIANAFLLHMVRNIAGLLMDVGAGEKTPADAKTILLVRDRKQSSKTARPDGLYLSGVEYPARFKLPGLASDAGFFGLLE